MKSISFCFIEIIIFKLCRYDIREGLMVCLYKETEYDILHIDLTIRKTSV